MTRLRPIILFSDDLFRPWGNPSKESPEHYYSKKWLYSELLKRVDQMVNVSLLDEDSGSSATYSVNLLGLTPVLECAYPDGISVEDTSSYFAVHGRYPRMIFDVGLVDDNENVVGAFEIFYTNAVSRQKIDKIITAGVFCFEMDALSVDGDGAFIDTGRIDARRLIMSTPGRRRIRCINPLVGMARGA
jgi:hypothetical protein